MFAKMCPAAPWSLLANTRAELKCRPLNIRWAVFAKSTDSIQAPILSLLSNKQRKQARHGNSKKDTDSHYESQNCYWNSINEEFSLSSWD